MKTETEILDILKDYFETVVPQKLADYTPVLPNFDDYSDQPPFDIDKKELCVYLADGEDNENEASQAVIVHCQIPGYKRPDQYMSVIRPLVVAFDVSLIDATTKECSWGTWYPGQSPEGGSGTFLMFLMIFKSDLDDCSREE